ncbi:MAG TPA: hypothetical protein VM409_05425, partial [Chloroflexia bacterium]|nr:hypothetical protein [Chloroflexia bacterium]
MPLLCIGGAIGLWGPLSARAAQQRFDTGVFLLGLTLAVLLVLTGLLVYMAWCVFSMSYGLSSSQLLIRAGGVRYIVPLDAVTSVRGPGTLPEDGTSSVPSNRPDRLGGLGALLGYHLGVTGSPETGHVIAVAT